MREEICDLKMSHYAFYFTDIYFIKLQEDKSLCDSDFIEIIYGGIW